MKLFIVTIVLLTSVIFPQKKAFEIEDLYKVRKISNSSISNDSERILYSVTSYDLPNNLSNTDIYFSDINGNNQEKLTSHKSVDSDPIWDPKSNGFYFVSHRTGKEQLFYMSLPDKKIIQISDFYMGVHSPKISPDGEKIIFTTKIFPELGIDENKTRKLKERMENGPVQAHISDSLFVRHWTEYEDGQYSHIILYNLKTKKYTDLTPGYQNSPTFSASGSDDYNFSPDSKHVIFSSKRVHNPEESTNSDLWIVNIDGTNLRNLTKQNEGYDRHGKFSPSGKFIAYLTQLIPIYESDKWRLAIYDTESKTHKIMTESIDNTINDFVWASDSKSIYFAIDEKGYNPILKINLDNLEITRVLEKKSVHTFSLTPNDKSILFNYSHVHKPVEIATLDLETHQITDITSFNKQIIEEVDFRPSEQIWVEGADGRKIQVFLVKPYDFDPNKKYPFIINIHGGPQMQWRDSFRGDWQVYPGAGYVLAFPNPHGSTGYGAEFTKDISTNWDGNVYTDVMKVMDHLQELPYLDKERMGAMGWSYGGYFMNLLQAKGNRFKCLVSMMGIYDLEDFYLETEELWFTNYDLGGNPWERKEQFDRQSPSKYVQNFATPTLIISGKKDYRISYTQSLRYFTALQLKEIDSRLIIFDNDGHWPDHLKSMPLYYNAHLEWFHKYLGGDPAPWNSKDLVRNQVFE